MNQRLKAIADAATRLFLQQGYAKTQISHIAKAVDVSVGTIYLDFAGKKEISQFILKCIVDPEFIDNKFEKPITNDLFIGLEDEIKAFFDKMGKDFSWHLEKELCEYSFEALISDTFDMLSRYGVGFLFIEKNQMDFPKLSGQYTSYRRQFFSTMNRYLEGFIAQGTIRNLENTELIGTLIIETLSWWAIDIHYTSFETQNVPTDLAKFVCMDNIISAYKR